MAMYWADPKQVGLEAGDCFLSCDADNELVARMLWLDEQSLPIVSGIGPAATSALTGEAVRIILDALKTWDLDSDDQLANFVGVWMYGFQLGHDYAVKYGSLRC